jgi:hypothetical protein
MFCQETPEAVVCRDLLSHKLMLVPALTMYLSTRPPRLPRQDPLFEALFGVSPEHAATIMRDSTLKDFRVEQMLEYHAHLWSHGIPDEFIAAFDDWLLAINDALSKADVHPSSKVNNGDELAEKARQAAEKDKERAHKHDFHMNRATLLRRLNRKDLAYHLVNVVGDWKKRGLIGRILGFVELKEEDVVKCWLKD